MEQTGPVQLVQGSEIDFISLFLQSGPVVKTVMIGLMLASVICWAIILEKTLSLWWAGRADRKFLQRFRAGIRQPNAKVLRADCWPICWWNFPTLIPMAACATRSPAALLLSWVTYRAAVKPDCPCLQPWPQPRPSSACSAPLGDHQQFAAIADSKNTSLAVVAPGIAEALLSTAMGLLAAIPAAVFYNRLNLTVTGSLQTLEALGHEVLIRVARQQPLDSKS